MKKTKDFDNVFKTLKTRHIRLFIAVINETFGKEYPLDAPIDVLSAEGYLTEQETDQGGKELEEKVTDFLIHIGNETFLLECQSYDDESMAIRLAEYSFIAARKSAIWDIGKAFIPMPSFSVVYVRCTANTPKKTSITFSFPNGEQVLYEADNVILEDLSKEHIIEKRLFPYIPFYIARYERDIVNARDVSKAISDLEYFRDEMSRLHEDGELTDVEIVDLMGFVNTIITHFTDGNEAEERLVNVMGGVVIETESERLIKLGESRAEEKGIKSLVETCQKFGISRNDTAKQLSEQFGLTESCSADKVFLYWKP